MSSSPAAVILYSVSPTVNVSSSLRPPTKTPLSSIPTVIVPEVVVITLPFAVIGTSFGACIVPLVSSISDAPLIVKTSADASNVKSPSALTDNFTPFAVNSESAHSFGNVAFTPSATVTLVGTSSLSPSVNLLFIKVP